MFEVKCKHCRGKNFQKQGFRKTEHRGKIQKYLCLDCKRNFTHDDGFYRMRTPPEAITKAIDLYFSNLSSRKVRNHYRRHEPLSRSHVTVLNWCRKYAKKVQHYAKTLTPQISGKCYADDTEIPVKGNRHHFWVSIDWDTRYINATHYSVFSGRGEAYTFLKQMRPQNPLFIQTDAAPFYPRAIRHAFWRGNKLGIQHRTTNARRTGIHNVRIETVFSKIKDRVYDMRGLKAAWSANLLLAGIVLQHNFIEAHTTTGKIPAELANISTTTHSNRWLSIIQQATFGT